MRSKNLNDVGGICAMYDELKLKYKKIIGWGAGGNYIKYGQAYEPYLSYLVDSDLLKQDTKIGNIMIVSPEQLIHESASECLVVIFSSYIEEIREDIKTKGQFDVIDGYTLFHLSENRQKMAGNMLFAQDYFLKCQDKLICCIETIDYIVTTGGGAKLVAELGSCLESKGYNMFHLVPIKYYKMSEDEEMIWLIYRGMTVGIFSLDNIPLNINECKHMIIHSPQHAAHLIEKIYGKMEHLQLCLFYLHDFSCVCSQQFLPIANTDCFAELRNGCYRCKYKEEQYKVTDMYKRLFAHDNMMLIAPSQIVFDRIRQVYPGVNMTVIPHDVCEWETSAVTLSDRLRIAFVGYALEVKGWRDFKQIVRSLQEQYDFYCMGKCEDRIEGVKYVDICLEGKEQQLCMKEALQQYGIDMAFLGSICCETYSFTYIEASESGSFILTTEKSGNICESVKRIGNGYVGKDVEDLILFLQKEKTELRDILGQPRAKIVSKTQNLEFLKYISEKEICS